jgi:hypothetical protein
LAACFLYARLTGYLGSPLHERLGIKPGHTIAILNPPPNIDQFLEVPPGTVCLGSLNSDLDLVLSFYTSAQQLHNDFPAMIASIKWNGMIWISWPERASGMATDLDENLVRDTGLAAGVVDVNVCAMDVKWSGLKFVRRLVDR